MPVYAQNDDFGGICDFPGVRKWTLGVPFSSKKCKNWTRAKSTEPPGFIQDATCDPKRPRDQFLSILVCILVDLGAIFAGFGIDF